MKITGRQLRAAISLAGIPYKTFGEAFGVSEQRIKQYCKRENNDVLVLKDQERKEKIIRTLREHNVVFIGGGVKYMEYPDVCTRKC